MSYVNDLSLATNIPNQTLCSVYSIKWRIQMIQCFLIRYISIHKYKLVNSNVNPYAFIIPYPTFIPS